MTIIEINNINVEEIENLEEAKKLLGEVNKWLEDHSETLESYLEELTDEEKATVYNAYAKAGNYEQMYPMDMFDEMMGNLAPSDVLRKVDMKNFSLNDDFFWYDGYGDAVSGSISDFVEKNFFSRDIAAWLKRNDYIVDKEVDDILWDWSNEKDDAEDVKENLECRIEDLEDSEDSED